MGPKKNAGATGGAEAKEKKGGTSVKVTVIFFFTFVCGRLAQKSENKSF